MCSLLMCIAHQGTLGSAGSLHVSCSLVASSTIRQTSLVAHPVTLALLRAPSRNKDGYGGNVTLSTPHSVVFLLLQASHVELCFLHN